MGAPARRLAGEPRGLRRPHRLEVWYLTATDPDDGTGLWIHHEHVSPPDGPPVAHGWACVFPPDAAPVTERFGPVAHVEGGPDPWSIVGDATLGPEGASGRAGRLAWDLRWGDGGPPLWTFPRVAWSRELLPGAQVVVVPSAALSGSLALDGTDAAVGPRARVGVSHIFGHGNARRWAWLHADLGGGDVCEVVTAVSTRPGLRRLPPTAFVRLRLDGRDRPAGGRPAIATRTRLGLPDWSVSGRLGRDRFRLHVHQPPDRCVALAYEDPDGAPAICTNTEQADVTLVLGSGADARTWTLSGTGHAEVGTRTGDPHHPEQAV